MKTLGCIGSRLASAGVAAALLLATASSTALADGSTIGPNQGFVGRVNGGFSKVTISMACFGPVVPGQTGHPMSGQTLEVIPPPPVVYGGIHPGYTGSLATLLWRRDVRRAGVEPPSRAFYRMAVRTTPVVLVTATPTYR